MLPILNTIHEKLSGGKAAEALERLGAALLPVAARLPARPGAVLIATGLNVALARGEAAELEPLVGKVLAIRISDAALIFHFMITAEGFSACSASQAPTVVISAAAADFVRLAMRRVDADTLFFSRRLTMEGNTELGLLLKNRLDALEFTWQDGSLPRPLELARALRRAAFPIPGEKQIRG